MIRQKYLGTVTQITESPQKLNSYIESYIYLLNIDFREKILALLNQNSNFNLIKQ